MKFLQKRVFGRGGKFIYQETPDGVDDVPGVVGKKEEFMSPEIIDLSKGSPAENSILSMLGDSEHIKMMLDANLEGLSDDNKKIMQTTLDDLYKDLAGNGNDMTNFPEAARKMIESLSPVLDNKELEAELQEFLDWMVAIPEGFLAANPVENLKGNKFFNALKQADLDALRKFESANPPDKVRVHDGHVDLNIKTNGRWHPLQGMSRFSERFLRRGADSAVLFYLSASATRKRFYDVFSSSMDPATAQTLAIIGGITVGFFENYNKKTLSKFTTSKSSFIAGMGEFAKKKPVLLGVGVSATMASFLTVSATGTSAEADAILGREMAKLLGTSADELKKALNGGTLTVLMKYLSNDINVEFADKKMKSFLQQYKDILEKEGDKGYLTGSKGHGENFFIIMEMGGVQAEDVSDLSPKKVKLFGYYKDPESYKGDGRKPKEQSAFNKNEKNKYKKYKAVNDRLVKYKTQLGLGAKEVILDKIIQRFDESFFLKNFGQTHEALTGNKLTAEDIVNISELLENTKGESSIITSISNYFIEKLVEIYKSGEDLSHSIYFYFNPELNKDEKLKLFVDFISANNESLIDDKGKEAFLKKLKSDDKIELSLSNLNRIINIILSAEKNKISPKNISGIITNIIEKEKSKDLKVSVLKESKEKKVYINNVVIEEVLKFVQSNGKNDFTENEKLAFLKKLKEEKSLKINLADLNKILNFIKGGNLNPTDINNFLESVKGNNLENIESSSVNSKIVKLVLNFIESKNTTSFSEEEKSAFLKELKLTYDENLTVNDFDKIVNFIKDARNNKLSYKKIEKLVNSIKDKETFYQAFDLLDGFKITMLNQNLPAGIDGFPEVEAAKKAGKFIKESFAEAITRFQTEDLVKLNNIIKSIGTEGREKLKARGARINRSFETPEIKFIAPPIPELNIDKIFTKLDKKIKSLESDIIARGVNDGKVTEFEKDAWFGLKKILGEPFKEYAVGTRIDVVAADKGEAAAWGSVYYYLLGAALLTFSPTILGIPYQKKVGRLNKQAVKKDQEELRDLEQKAVKGLFKSFTDVLEITLEDKNSPLFRLFYQLSPDGKSMKKVMDLPTEYEVNRIFRRVMQDKTERALESFIMQKKSEDSGFTIKAEKMRYFLRESFHPTASTPTYSSFSMDEVILIRKSLQKVLENPQELLNATMDKYLEGGMTDLKEYNQNLIRPGSQEKRGEEDVFDSIRAKSWRKKILVAYEERELLLYMESEYKKGKISSHEIIQKSGIYASDNKGRENEKFNVEYYFRDELTRVKLNIEKGKNMLVEVLTDGHSPLDNKKHRDEVLERVLPKKEIKSYVKLMKKTFKNTDISSLSFAGIIQQSVLNTIEEKVNATRIRKLENIYNSLESEGKRKFEEVFVEAPNLELIISLDRFRSKGDNNYKNVIKKYLETVVLDLKLKEIQRELEKGENGEDLDVFIKKLLNTGKDIERLEKKLISDYEKKVEKINSGEFEKEFSLNLEHGTINEKITKKSNDNSDEPQKTETPKKSSENLAVNDNASEEKFREELKGLVIKTRGLIAGLELQMPKDFQILFDEDLDKVEKTIENYFDLKQAEFVMGKAIGLLNNKNIFITKEVMEDLEADRALSVEKKEDLRIVKEKVRFLMKDLVNGIKNSHLYGLDLGNMSPIKIEKN